MLQSHRASARILSIAAALALGSAACVNDSTAPTPTPTKPLLSYVPGDNPLASDNFDRADQNPLAGNWTIAPPLPWSQSLALSANHVVPTNWGGDGEAYYSAMSWPADQYSKAKLYVDGSAGANQGFGLLVRQSATAVTHYRLMVDHASSNNVGLDKAVDGSYTNLAYFTQAWTDGDEWELRVTGTTLQIFVNGNPVGTNITDTSIGSGSPGIAYSCYANSGAIDDWEGGGIGSDPDWTAPGKWLGIGLGECFVAAGATGADTDQDGLTELCEESLANSFAPTLRYNPNYDVGREPRWAARPTADNKVVIAYLLSYYNDGGPVYDHDWGDHHGDSEGIYLTLYYKTNTQHWVLDEAIYSRHLSEGHYSRGPDGYPILDYVMHPGWYPTAYVSSRKHANYSSELECSNSGFDTCLDANSDARVETQLLNGQSGNIGSSTVRFADCVGTLNTSRYYHDPDPYRLECYWSYKRFRGWVPDWIEQDVGAADPYNAKLLARGFFPAQPPSLISGPTMMRANVVCSWSATAPEGTPPYTYDWVEHNYGGHFSEITSGTSIVQFGGGETGTSIDLTITDADGNPTYGSAWAQVDENLNSNCQ